MSTIHEAQIAMPSMFTFQPAPAMKPNIINVTSKVATHVIRPFESDESPLSYAMPASAADDDIKGVVAQLLTDREIIHQKYI